MTSTEWIAVAQVYATLALYKTQRWESGYQGHFGPTESTLRSAWEYEYKAKQALKIAGIEDA